MSAPNTNVEKQERRHRPALLGIRGVLVFVALITIGLVFYIMVVGSDPDQAADPGALPNPQADTDTPVATEPAPAGN
jgi:hypothetical protein